MRISDWSSDVCSSDLSIKADGTVLVLNPNGVLFNGTSQVNVRSIVATGLEIGRSRNNGIPLTLRQRNDEFLNFGLLGYADQASQSEASNVFTFSAQEIGRAHV